MADLQLLLLADFIDLLARGIPVILFVLWLIGQALSERQKQPKAAPRQQRQAPAKPQQAATEIEDEIDAFLRRAAEKQGQPRDEREKREETVILLPPKPEASAPARPKVIQPGNETRTPRRSDRPLSRPAAAAAEPPRVRGASPRAAAAAPMAGPAEVSFRDSIRGPLSIPLSQRQSHLGEVVALADDKLEAHLQSVFDHPLGTLQQRQTAPVREVSGSPIARTIVELLKNPAGIQQMIIINEIMRRPEI